MHLDILYLTHKHKHAALMVPDLRFTFERDMGKVNPNGLYSLKVVDGVLIISEYDVVVDYPITLDLILQIMLTTIHDKLWNISIVSTMFSETIDEGLFEQ